MGKIEQTGFINISTSNKLVLLIYLHNQKSLLDSTNNKYTKFLF